MDLISILPFLIIIISIKNDEKVVRNLLAHLVTHPYKYLKGGSSSPAHDIPCPFYPFVFVNCSSPQLLG